MSLNISGNMKVKTLEKSFKEEFGLSLRVYNRNKNADDNATLASIRKGDTKGGELSLRTDIKIGNLENKVKELFGIKVQVATPDNSKLCNNDDTLSEALKKA